MQGVRRGRRAGHAGKGRPGTWETSPSPPATSGPGAATRTAQAPGAGLYPGSEQGEAWYRRAKETKQGGMGGEGSESADSTGEIGEPAPRDPTEESGGPGMGLLEGQMARTPSREVISTRQEKLAELARIEPKLELTTLAHHIDETWLREACWRQW